MRFLSRKLARTPDEERMLTVANVPPLMLRPTASGVRVTRANALFIADVYAAVRVLSEAVASLPLAVYRRRGGERTRVHGGGLADLLDRPSPAQTRSALLGTLMAHLQLHGNAFVGLYRGASERVEQLALLTPERMQVELRNGRLHYRYADEEGRVFLAHRRRPDPRPRAEHGRAYGPIRCRASARGAWAFGGVDRARGAVLSERRAAERHSALGPGRRRAPAGHRGRVARTPPGRREHRPDRCRH